MFDLRKIIELERKEQHQLLEAYESKMKGLPKGTLSVSERDGRRYYTKSVSGQRIYLGANAEEEVRNIQLRKFLEEISDRITQNDQAMLHLLQQWQEISPDLVEAEMSKAYQFENKSNLALLGIKDYSEWGNQPYKRSNAHPEHLTHRTLKGDMVRSKSEVIIANTLLTKGIPYHYEEVLEIGNKILAPDFHVAVPRLNRFKILEHFGKMHDPEYREINMNKINHYLACGYRLYEDIIFTFDDKDGNFDALSLDILLTNFCM